MLKTLQSLQALGSALEAGTDGVGAQDLWKKEMKIQQEVLMKQWEQCKQQQEQLSENHVGNITAQVTPSIAFATPVSAAHTLNCN